MTDYTAKDYARLAHWQTQKPHAQQNPELIDALLYAKELASARGTTEACEARRQAARGGGTVVEKTRETSPIDYTEREVREAANTFGSGDIYNMLNQLADMLAERENAEPVAKWEKSHYGDYPVVIWRGDYRAKVGDKLYTHPAAQPRVPDGYVMVPLNDDNWPPLQVVRAMLDCQDADPADGTESEGYYGLRAAIKEWEHMLAAQESGR